MALQKSQKAGTSLYWTPCDWCSGRRITATWIDPAQQSASFRDYGFKIMIFPTSRKLGAATVHGIGIPENRKALLPPYLLVGIF